MLSASSTTGNNNNNNNSQRCTPSVSPKHAHHHHHQQQASSGGIAGAGGAADVMLLHPGVIRYMADSVSHIFKTGQKLTELFEALLFERIDIRELEPITVMFRWGAYWAINGNHRLYIYKKLEQIGRITEIKVYVKPLSKEMFDRLFTTHNNGTFVCIRGEPNIDRKLEEIAAEYWRKQSSVTYECVGTSASVAVGATGPLFPSSMASTTAQQQLQQQQLQLQLQGSVYCFNCSFFLFN